MSDPTPEIVEIAHQFLRFSVISGSPVSFNHPDLRALLDHLAAVTAERDQALEALAATNKLGAFETGKTIGAAEVRKELDQARQMLADAPHGEDCMLGFHYEDATVGVCDCWKAGL